MRASSSRISEQVNATTPGITPVTPGPGRPNKRKGKKFPPVRSKITINKNNQNQSKSKLGKDNKGNSSEEEGGFEKKAGDGEACSKPSVGPAPPFAKKDESAAPSAGSSSSGLTLKGLKVSPALRRAGEYRLGPKVGSSPVKCIEQYLARKDGTDQFYVIKILTRKSEGEKETADDIQGKTLIHTEHSLLSLLQNESGVIREYGLFNDTIEEEFVDEKGITATKQVRRVCLVMDCFTSHEFSPKYGPITNMQLYVIREKRLKEAEAIRVFFKVVEVVERLHKLNIVHRDLKLGNIILNQETKEVTLANFCLGKHLGREEEPLKDQRGSPAYISPDVICGKPYLGKPSDMWALGVVLYTMLYGQFPFYDQSPTQLFRKIKLGEFSFLPDVDVSQKTIELIKSLLDLDPKKRLTASATLDKVRSIIAEEQKFLSDSDLQIVPDCPVGQAGRPMKRKCSCSTKESTLEMFADIALFMLELPKSEVDELEPKCERSNAAYLDRLRTLYEARKEEQKKLARISPTSSADGSTSDDDSDNQLVPVFEFSSDAGITPTSGKSGSSGLDGDAVVPMPLGNKFSFPVTTCLGGGWVRV